LLIAGILSFCGCGSHAPKVTWCFIDGDKEIVSCRDPEHKEFDLTIKEADKFIAQPLEDAQKVRNYVLELERRAAQCEGK